MIFLFEAAHVFDVGVQGKAKVDEKRNTKCIWVDF